MPLESAKDAVLKWGQLIIVLGSLGLWALRKLLLDEELESKSTLMSRDEDIGIVSYSHFYFDTEEVLRSFQHNNSTPSLHTIYEEAAKILVDEYIHFTTETRQRRRLISSRHPDQYLTLILEYEQEVENMLRSTREELEDNYKLTFDQLTEMEESSCFYAETDGVSRARQVLQEEAAKCSSLVSVDSATLLEVANYEICLLTTQAYLWLQEKLKDTEDPETIYKVVQTYCQDMVFERFGLEAEDIEQAKGKTGIYAEVDKMWLYLRTKLGNCDTGSLLNDCGSVSSKNHSNCETQPRSKDNSYGDRAPSLSELTL